MFTWTHSWSHSSACNFCSSQNTCALQQHKKCSKYFCVFSIEACGMLRPQYMPLRRDDPDPVAASLPTSCYSHPQNMLHVLSHSSSPPHNTSCILDNSSEMMCWCILMYIPCFNNTKIIYTGLLPQKFSRHCVNTSWILTTHLCTAQRLVLFLFMLFLILTTNVTYQSQFFLLFSDPLFNEL